MFGSLGFIEHNTVALSIEQNYNLGFEQFMFINDDSLLSLLVFDNQAIAMDVQLHGIFFIHEELIKVNDLPIDTEHSNLDGVHYLLYLHLTGEVKQKVLLVVFLFRGCVCQDANVADSLRVENVESLSLGYFCFLGDFI